MQTANGCFHQQLSQSPLIAAALVIASRNRFWFGRIKIICCLIVSEQPRGRQSLSLPGQRGEVSLSGQCQDPARELSSLPTAWFSSVTAAPQSPSWVRLGHGCKCEIKHRAHPQIQQAQRDAQGAEGSTSLAIKPAI